MARSVRGGCGGQAAQRHLGATAAALNKDEGSSFSDMGGINLWIALDDATLQSGCLFYLPGSHKLAAVRDLGRIVSMGLNSVFEVYPEWRAIPPVPVPVKAGSAIFHDSMTCHGAAANLSLTLRRAMNVSYVPDGARYNGVQNVLSDEYVSRLAIGDVLDNAEEVPLVSS